MTVKLKKFNTMILRLTVKTKFLGSHGYEHHSYFKRQALRPRFRKSYLISNMLVSSNLRILFFEVFKGCLDLPFAIRNIEDNLSFVAILELA